MKVRTLVFAMCLLFSINQGAFAQGISGRVTSASSEPLAGVTVWNDFPIEKATTDADGIFHLSPAAPSLNLDEKMLRFQMNGYRPRTLMIKEGSHPAIVLEQAADALWKPPVCELTPNSIREGVMGFRRPKDAIITRGFDVDYGTVRIRHDKNALLLEYGSSPWGLPVDHFFENISELHERDIQYKPNIRTAEYRGRRSDGTYFRFIGMFTETIEYDHATKEEADYFDAIMDTFCWVRGVAQR